MIDITKLRTKPHFYRKATADKQMDPALVDRLLEVDEKHRALIGEIETLRAKRNEVARSKDIEAGKGIKAELKKKEPALKETEAQYIEGLNAVPNPALESVPVGKSDKENVEIKRWGTPRKFDFTPKDHLEIGKSLGILDFEAGAKVAGSQFYYLCGDGAPLQPALFRYSFT